MLTHNVRNRATVPGTIDRINQQGLFQYAIIRAAVSPAPHISNSFLNTSLTSSTLYSFPTFYWHASERKELSHVSANFLNYIINKKMKKLLLAILTTLAQHSPIMYSQMSIRKRKDTLTVVIKHKTLAEIRKTKT